MNSLPFLQKLILHKSSSRLFISVLRIIFIDIGILFREREADLRLVSRPTLSVTFDQNPMLVVLVLDQIDAGDGSGEGLVHLPPT